MSRQTDHSATIRPADGADIDPILALENSCFDDVHERFCRRQVRSLIANPRARVVVAQVAGGQVLGWAAALVRNSATRATGRIYAIAVAPEARGLKLGRRLMENLLGWLKRRGAGGVFLEVRADNAPAIELYKKLGFVVRHDLPHYYAPGRHGVGMVLR